MLRAAEAEAQAEASRAMIGADMGPDVNGAMSAVHGARNRIGCPEVARKEKPPTSPQVRGLDGAVSRYSHSIKESAAIRYGRFTSTHSIRRFLIAV